MSREKRLIGMFGEFVDYYTHLGNVYKVAAYQRAISAIETVGLDSYRLAKMVGDRIFAKIQEFINTGAISELCGIRKNPMLNILGFNSPYDKYKLHGKTAKEIKTIMHELVMKGKLELTHQQKLGLRYLVDLNTRIPRREVEQIASAIGSLLRPKSYMIMGSYRRKAATSGDIDILTTTPLPIDVISKQPWFVDFISCGAKKCSFLVRGAQIRAVDLFYDDRLKMNPAMILYLTGSKNHNLHMRSIAKKQGLLLNQYGLFRLQNGKAKEIPLEDERDIFSKLRIPYVLPEDR